MSKHPEEKRHVIATVVRQLPSVAVEDELIDGLLDAFLIFPRHLHLESIMLTSREGEILALVAQGMTNDEIAQELYLSSNTIKTHIKRLSGKLSVSNRTALAVQAIRAGLLEI